MGWSGVAFTGPIYDAVESGNIEEVKALLKDNPNLVFSKQWEVGASWTPLWIAASRNRKEIAELLLANKADVNARDKNGLTPLHRTAEGGELRNFSTAALPQSLISNFKSVAEMLLANGADINATNNQGETPLHLAAAKGFTHMALLLRQHGGHE